MRPGLVGYFDLGSSAGLSDAALRKDLREPLPDIGMVGLLNPLGQGKVVDLLGSQSYPPGERRPLPRSAAPKWNSAGARNGATYRGTSS